MFVAGESAHGESAVMAATRAGRTGTNCQVTTPYYLCSLAAKYKTVQWTVQTGRRQFCQLVARRTKTGFHTCIPRCPATTLPPTLFAANLLTL